MTVNFAIVTDSTSDLPAELARERQIYIAPLHILWGRDHFVDGVTITAQDFYARLANDPEMPTSSQPSPKEFADIYKQAVRETGAPAVIVLTISAELSGTFSSAQMGANMVDFPVEIIDLRTASIATGLPVLKLAEARDSGMSLEQACALARSYANRTQIYFIVDTLEYLHRGGRIGGARRLLGTALNIKPLLHIEHGKIEAKESIRTRKRALNRLQEIYREVNDLERPLHVGIIHANALSDAEALGSAIQAIRAPDSQLITQISAVISVHTGPGAVGFAILQ